MERFDVLWADDNGNTIRGTVVDKIRVGNAGSTNVVDRYLVIDTNDKTYLVDPSFVRVVRWPESMWKLNMPHYGSEQR